MLGERGAERAKRVVDRQRRDTAHLQQAPIRPSATFSPWEKGARPSPLGRGVGGEGLRAYAPVWPAVWSVARSSLTPGPMVEETAARRR